MNYSWTGEVQPRNLCRNLHQIRNVLFHSHGWKRKETQWAAYLRRMFWCSDCVFAGREFRAVWTAGLHHRLPQKSKCDLLTPGEPCSIRDSGEEMERHAGGSVSLIQHTPTGGGACLILCLFLILSLICGVRIRKWPSGGILEGKKHNVLLSSLTLWSHERATERLLSVHTKPRPEFSADFQMRSSIL